MKGRLRVLNLEPENYSSKAKALISEFGVYEEANISYCINNTTRDTDALIVRLANKIDSELLQHFPNLKYILSATTGLDHIDLEYTKLADIQVISLRENPEFLKEITSTAEMTWGLILSLVRNIPAAIQSVKEGKWKRDNYKGIELKDKVLGIIGLGRLGSQVARYASVFGMQIKYYDPFISSAEYDKCTDIKEVLKYSDIITLHVHLNQSTMHLLNESNLQFIKHGSYIVNTSRGGVIDEECVLKLLETGQISGIAVDVLESELRNPFDSELYKASIKGQNIIITPHIGGVTYDAMEKCEVFIADIFKEIINKL